MTTPVEAKRVTEAEVIAVPEPTFTKTWHPVSHAKIVNAVQTVCEDRGIGITSTDYSMNKSGTKLFASYGLDIGGNGDCHYMLGFRNAIDMSFAIGFTAGTMITVCSNMMLSGDLLIFRKHTSALNENLLLKLSDDALGGAIKKMDALYRWHQSLKEYYVPIDDFKKMTFDLIAAGVFSGGQFSNYMDCVDAERKISNYGTVLDGARSLYVVHGGVTRLLRNANLLRLSDSTAKLETVVNNYLEYKKAI